MRAQLRSFLEADPASPSGLRWRVSPRRNVAAGSPAGCLCNIKGYWLVRVDGRLYRAHRLVWALSRDEDPGKRQIDHIDGNRSNNAPANLRLATSSENTCNSVRRRDNTSGHKGVSRCSDRASWKVFAKLNDKQIHKSFSDSKHGGTESALAAAVEWVTAKREELHGAFARHE
jgi:hypothetical protein